MAGYIGSKSSVTLVDGITKNGGTLEGDLSFGDNDKAIFGAGSDLQIYHDGFNSYIDDAGQGVLAIRSNSVRIQKYTGEEMVQADADGAVKLYYDNAVKLATTSDGVNIQGAITSQSPNSGVLLEEYAADAFGANFTMRKSRNATIGGQTAVASGDTLGNITFQGSDGDEFVSGASIQSFVDGTPGNNDMPGNLVFKTTPDGSSTLTERLRITSSGNVLISTTSVNPHQDGSGIALRENAGVIIGVDGTHAIIAARHNSDGEVIRIQKDNTTVGTIGTISDSLYIGTPYSNDSALRFSTNTIHPCTTTGSPRDNAIQLGYSSARFNDAFITNGVTTGSDRTEKQDIATLTDTEMLVAARLSQTFRTYRWKDAVASKGDNARTHTGTIAQEVQAAFTAEGLDAGDYGLFCSDTWWETQTEVPAVEAVAEVTDEDGNVTTEAVEAVDAYTRTDTYDTEAEAPEGATERTRLGIRYPELLSFVAAYNEQRFASIEARLTALEA